VVSILVQARALCRFPQELKTLVIGSDPTPYALLPPPCSYGEVYLGTRGKQKVAVKVLRAGFGEDHDSLLVKLWEEVKPLVRQHGTQDQRKRPNMYS
jgi:hypothetical protein